MISIEKIVLWAARIFAGAGFLFMVFLGGNYVGYYDGYQAGHLQGVQDGEIIVEREQSMPAPVLGDDGCVYLFWRPYNKKTLWTTRIPGTDEIVPVCMEVLPPAAPEPRTIKTGEGNGSQRL
jgi:hypothetical protein